MADNQQKTRGSKGFPRSPETVEELWHHRGDIVEIDVYWSFVGRLLRKKLIGYLRVPPAWEDKDYFSQQHDLRFEIYSPNDREEYSFHIFKEGYTLDGELDVAGVGPVQRKILRESWIKGLVPSLDKIRILECKHT